MGPYLTRLALFARVFFSGSASGPFTMSRQAWDRLTADLDRWDRELECAAADLCRNVLGISIGDIVVFDSGARAIRVELEWVSLHTSGEEVRFSLSGRRFRKDGRPGTGKRTEYFGVSVENDLAFEGAARKADLTPLIAGERDEQPSLVGH